MTRTTNTRIAGVTSLIYIAAGIASLVQSGRAHATDVRALLTSFSALVLGVTLYAIPAFPFLMFGVVGLLASVGDFGMIRSGGIQRAPRLARHQ